MRASTGRQLAADGLKQPGQAQALIPALKALRNPVLPNRAGGHQAQQPVLLR
jgi:hypothetical protein